MHIRDNLIRLVVPRPQGLLLFPELLPDTACNLYELLGAEFSQKRFGDLLGEMSGTVIPDRLLSAYLCRPDSGVAFQIVGASVVFTFCHSLPLAIMKHPSPQGWKKRRGVSLAATSL